MTGDQYELISHCRINHQANSDVYLMEALKINRDNDNTNLNIIRCTIANKALHGEHEIAFLNNRIP